MKKIPAQQLSKIKNIFYLTYTSFIVLFAILGICDQIFGFLLMSSNPVGIGTLSVFTFLAILMLCIFIFYKIVMLIKNKVNIPEKAEEKK